MSFVLELQAMEGQPSAVGPMTIPTSWSSVALCGSSLSFSLCIAPATD
ncbi:SapB/AmfS family lanthipeptide [Amycolatopsis lurida]